VFDQPSRGSLRGGEEGLLRADVGVGAVESEDEVSVEVDHGHDRGGRVDALHPVRGDVHPDRGGGGRAGRLGVDGATERQGQQVHVHAAALARPDRTPAGVHPVAAWAGRRDIEADHAVAQVDPLLPDQLEQPRGVRNVQSDLGGELLQADRALADLAELDRRPGHPGGVLLVPHDFSNGLGALVGCGLLVGGWRGAGPAASRASRTHCSAGWPASRCSSRYRRQATVISEGGSLPGSTSRPSTRIVGEPGKWARWAAAWSPIKLLRSSASMPSSAQTRSTSASAPA
jgi:hypothetical protein